MLKSQIETGRHYQARVSGNLVTVRVDQIDTVSIGTGRQRPDRTVFRVTNLATGRRLVFRSAAKFRREVPEPVSVGGEPFGQRVGPDGLLPSYRRTLQRRAEERGEATDPFRSKEGTDEMEHDIQAIRRRPRLSE